MNIFNIYTYLILGAGGAHLLYIYILGAREFLGKIIAPNIYTDIICVSTHLLYKAPPGAGERTRIYIKQVRGS